MKAAEQERPILFSAPMVRALLDGSKTQTRRIVKQLDPEHGAVTTGRDGKPMGACWAYGGPVITCPYGQRGDRLWVRETWGVASNTWDDDGNLADWTPDRPATAIREMRFGQGYYSGHVIYAADGTYEWAGDDDGGGEARSAWHPSIHMPRVASRILLEVVSVRVEQLNDCSETDAKAEGARECDVTGREVILAGPSQRGSHLRHYRNIWETINGAGSWAVNPWVWVIEFKRIAP